MDKSDELMTMLMEGMEKQRKITAEFFDALSNGDIDFFKKKNEELENIERPEQANAVIELIKKFSHFLTSNRFKKERVESYFNCLSETVGKDLAVLSLYFFGHQNDALSLIKKHNIEHKKTQVSSFIMYLDPFSFNDDYRMLGSDAKKRFDEEKVKEFFVLSKFAMLDEKLNKDSSSLAPSTKSKVKI